MQNESEHNQPNFKEINSNIRFVFVLFIWSIIFCIICSVMLYPINYLTLKIPPTYYFLSFATVFISSGVLFHRFYLYMYEHVVVLASNQNERFWNVIALILFNLTGPFAGLLIYLFTGNLIFGGITVLVYFYGSVSWYIPLNLIRKELKKRRERIYNTVFIDEDGNKRLYFKI